MAFRKLILPELIPEPETPTMPKPPPSPPTIEKVDVYEINQEDTPTIIAATSKKPDPPSGWKRLLLDGDPISVTDLTKVFQDPTNVFSGRVTDQFTTQIWAPAAGQSIQVSLLQCFSKSISPTTVAFRFGTGNLRFETPLQTYTGFVANLIKTVWRGPTGAALNIYCYDPSPFITYTVLGETLP